MMYGNSHLDNQLAGILYFGHLASAHGNDRLDDIHSCRLQRAHQCRIKLLLHVSHHCDLCEHCWIQVGDKDNGD